MAAQINNETLYEDFENYEPEQNTISLGNSTTKTYIPPKHQILAHEGYEVVVLPNGEKAILEDGRLFRIELPDLEITLQILNKWEHKLWKAVTAEDTRIAIEKLKYYYRIAVWYISPKHAEGWNRWSDDILELFVQNKIHKILWGNGNCGKSAVMGLLLYIKWRIKPNGRMVVVATKVVAEAKHRVFGYIKEIHNEAPLSYFWEFKEVDSSKEQGIYCWLKNEKTGKLVKGERACIVALPVKLDGATAEYGANLLGRHPDDRLIIAFDEAQELPESINSDKIFLNWYTNTNVEVMAWGNPVPVDLATPGNNDLLFKLGSTGLTERELKDKEKTADKTSTWSTQDTVVLHLTMLDSPKDDEDEVKAIVDTGNGVYKQRLHFLAGKHNVEAILRNTDESTPAYWSQVMGMPFLRHDGNSQQVVLSPAMVRLSREYPLSWAVEEEKLDYYMAVDSSLGDSNDDTAIVIARMGLMLDGRHGIDFMNGRGTCTVEQRDDEEFSETVTRKMWELSQTYKIPLKNIAVDVHTSGDVMRYTIKKMIKERGYWANDVRKGEMFTHVNPTKCVTDRPLFKVFGEMRIAETICRNYVTELWVAVRCGIICRQIFNIPDFILRDFYTRGLKVGGTARGRTHGEKYVLETKKEMKARKLRSPNHGDAVTYLVDLCRYRNFRIQFIDAIGYYVKLGADFVSGKQRIQLKNRLGAVSSVLGLSEDLGVHIGASRSVAEAFGERVASVHQKRLGKSTYGGVGGV